MTDYTIQSKLEDKNGMWRSRVIVGGVAYYVGLERGSQVRMAFASRKQRGYRWYGRVQEYETGKRLFGRQVPKTVSVRSLLEQAGLIQMSFKKAHAYARELARQEQERRRVFNLNALTQRTEQIINEWRAAGRISD